MAACQIGDDRAVKTGFATEYEDLVTQSIARTPDPVLAEILDNGGDFRGTLEGVSTRPFDRAKDGSPESRSYFRLLGPLEMVINGQVLRPSGTIPACVLGMLLLDRGRLIPVHRLAAAVWDDELPDTALHQVRKAVSMLRGTIPDGKRIIVTGSDGYRIDIDEDQLDSGLFAIRLRRAQQAEAGGLLNNAVTEYKAALGLWRGSVLQGEGGSVLAGTSRGLEELRMRTAEEYISLRARLGESASLISELRALIDEEPLRESLRHQLILALYRSGRQAEALEEFTAVRKLLDEELGISPGAELVALHEAVLRQSPELNPLPPPARPEDDLPTAPISAPEHPPNTLPYDINDFIGRTSELRELLDFGRKKAAGGTRIVAVDGMGGAGKTALVIHAAHMLAEKFPDGQLYVDLHGYTPGGIALRSGAVLDHLLRVMGASGEQVPEDYPTKVALWRSITSRLRILLVLDNAADSDQVRGLIPNSPRCLVLATSRARLVDIAGAHWITLDLMSKTDCATLIGSVLGPDRATAEPGALDELVQLCDRLPLALRIAASRLGRRREWTIRHMTDLLRDEKRRVRELSSGQYSIAAALTLSYNSMSSPHRAAFRVLARHPGPSIARSCAAALMETSAEETDRIIEQILDIHLIQQVAWDRYFFHDLTRSFALDLTSEDSAMDDGLSPGLVGLEERLLRYYVHATTRACDLLFPGRARYGFSLEAPNDLLLPEFDDQRDALQWFSTEDTAIRAVLDLGIGAGLHGHTAMLARNFTFYLHSRGYYDGCRSVGEYAVAAARELSDLPLLCVSLTNLALADWQTGNSSKAATVLGEALELAKISSDARLEAAALSRLGIVRWSLGQLGEALAAYDTAVTLHKRHGSDRESAETLGNMCEILVLLGRAGDAVAAGSAAADTAHRIGDQVVEASALTEVAYAHADLGDHAAALRCVDSALERAEAAQAPIKIAAALLCRAAVLLWGGCLDEAEQCAEQALGLVQARGVRTRRAMAENLLGRIHMARGDAAAALAFHKRAYALASAINLVPVAAEARAGAAIALRELGEAAEAAGCQADADQMFDGRGVPHSAWVRRAE
jgi:DNA-binding SARP family transcriptional activator/tetratricopeptide (TPR) repeat protein